MSRRLNLFACLGALMLLLACGKDLGIVQGTVHFEGLPCQEGQTDFNTPPCNGPYPGYEIKVFKADNLMTPIFTTQADETGAFKIILPAGDYVIRTQYGKDKRNDQKNFPFTIEKNKITTLDISVRNGIK